MNKRILITGGAGFIGSHLCKKFIDFGYEVFCMDNLLTGDKKNIEQLFVNNNFVFIKADVTNYIHIPGKLDYILHFASPASPNDYLKYPIQTLKVGALGTHKALGLAKAKNAIFLLASTSEVYGDPKVHPQNESYYGHVNPVGPRGVYDEAKRYAEALTMAYHRYHKLNTKIVRIFNTYGPGMRINDGRVIPAFLSQAVKGEKLTIAGDGKQTRSFCYIDDTVDGIVKLLQSDYNYPVNIGNPVEYTILELAEIVKKLFNPKLGVTFYDLPKDDPLIRKPDISLAKKLLNWHPLVTLEQGLTKTYEYIRKTIWNQQKESGTFR